MKDVRGDDLKVDQTVARAVRSGNSAWLRIQKVTRVEDGKVYLDGSNVALQLPGNCVILEEN